MSDVLVRYWSAIVPKSSQIMVSFKGNFQIKFNLETRLILIESQPKKIVVVVVIGVVIVVVHVVVIPVVDPRNIPLKFG